ncbi:MAG: hypothetical protein CMF59_07260 [Leptospiraceae bacterium]|nr:hypothetical protein [Leptospiraceae bacterium]
MAGVKARGLCPIKDEKDSATHADRGSTGPDVTLDEHHAASASWTRRRPLNRCGKGSYLSPTGKEGQLFQRNAQSESIEEVGTRHRRKALFTRPAWSLPILLSGTEIGITESRKNIVYVSWNMRWQEEHCRCLFELD